MKKNDWILLVAVSAYSYLFYEQMRGINFLLFAVLMIVLMLIKNVSLVRQPAWIAAATGSLASAAAVFIYGNQLSFNANAISISLMAAFSLSSSSSLIVALINSAYSYLSSLVIAFIEKLERKKTEVVSKHPASVKAWLILIPLFVVMVFFSLYKSSNPLFENFTQSINLDFISWAWVRFTIVGFVFSFALFYQKAIPQLVAYDSRKSDYLQASQISFKTFFGNEFKQEHEHLSGKILFTLLNALLLIVNVLDVRYLWFDGTLPQGMTYSEFVHQGTGALITSILIAILIILYYFRGTINFIEKNSTIKWLAYLWIAQNIFMIVSTAFRNELYINEYSLTYKRIGVYVYLLLCVIGLVTTFIKIYKIKSNWFLFRKNAWIFYGVLIFSAFVNWDSFITNFNITRAEFASKEVDKNYLLTLAPANIPQLLTMDEKLTHKNMADEKNNSRFDSFSSGSEVDYVNDNLNDENFKKRLHNSLYYFVSAEQKADWQSWCIKRNQINGEIRNLNDAKKIPSLNLSQSGITSIQPILFINRIESLDVSINAITDFNLLNSFKELKSLNVLDCKIDSLEKFPTINTLTELNIAINNIKELKSLSKFPKLQSLWMFNNKLKSLDDMPGLTDLKELDCSNNSITDFQKLTTLKNLEKLDVSSMTISRRYLFGSMPSLKSLNFSNNNLNTATTNLSLVIAEMPKLEYLNLNKNELSTLNGIVFNDEKSLNNSITSLSISDNKFTSLQSITRLVNLSSLNASANTLSSLSGVESLQKLTSLEASNNNVLKNVEMLKSLPQLVNLNLSGDYSITNFDALKSLSSLISLDLSRTNFGNFQVLSNMKNLKSLNLAFCNITDLNFLKQFKKLEEVNLDSKYEFDLSPLYEMKQLRKITLRDELTLNEYKKLKSALPNTLIVPVRYVDEIVTAF